jgi:hypothetical protein
VAPPTSDSASGLSRRVALRLLEHHAHDDRVFEGYLRHFGEAHPVSERAIAKRRKDPRVIAALRAILDREEKRALRLQEGRQPPYSEDYGLVARYLAGLGDEKGVEAREKYKRYGRSLSRASQ